MKIYGNDNTNLTLTDKAFRFYSGCDSLRIIEREIDTEDGGPEYRYDISGIFSGESMTADEVNGMLEGLADETAEYMVKPEFWSAWGEDVDEDTIVLGSEVRRLACEWGVTVDELMEQIERRKT